MSVFLALAALADEPSNEHPETGEKHVPMYSHKMTPRDVVMAVWPDDAPAHIESDKCFVRLFVDDTGVVTHATASGCHASLQRVTQAAFSAASFEPVEVHGEPVKVVTDVLMEMERPKNRPTVTEFEERKAGLPETIRHPHSGATIPLVKDDTFGLAGTLPDTCMATVVFDAGGWMEDYTLHDGCETKPAKKTLKKLRIDPQGSPPHPIGVWFGPIPE